MIARFIEIRDECTCIPALAVQMVAADPAEDRFLWRCGYPRDQHTCPPSVILIKLSSAEAQSDPYHWSHGRTLQAAHMWIIDHFDALKDGDVVDVRVILGETATPAEAEIWTKEKAASCA
ncbi:MAG: hypothetical protein ACRECF_03665 [Methyloceanibacter sp.]